MEYAAFKEMIESGLIEYLPSRYAQAEVKVENRLTLNGVHQDCLAIEQEGMTGPWFLLEAFYQQAQDGRDIEDIMKEIAIGYQASVRPTADYMDSFLDYGMIQQEIYVTACNARLNREMLEKIPHEIYGDIALAYQINRNVNVQNTVNRFVTNGMVKVWDISMEELSRTAWKNMRQDMPPSFNDIMPYVFEGQRPEIDQSRWEVTGDGKMYILTDRQKYNGAVYMFDSGLMGKLADLFGSDLYLCPSSIDEVLVISEREKSVAERIVSAVPEVNKEQLPPDKILSGEVYRFCRESHELLLNGVPVRKNEMSGPEDAPGMQMM